MFLPFFKSFYRRSLASIGMAAIATIATVCTAPGARAAALNLGGLTFSEASGDFRITGGRIEPNAVRLGSSALNLFILEQEVFGPNINLFVAIDGFLTQCPYLGGCLFPVLSVVTNRTGTPWNFFDHELQEIAGIASPEEDGLSFAQGINGLRPFSSTGFAQVDEVTDVRDFVNYSGGTVAPGSSVIFRYVIADTTPLNRFYLLQRPNFQVGGGGFVNPTPIASPPLSRPEPDPIGLPPSRPEPDPGGGTVTPDPAPDNTAAVPEPATLLGVLAFGAIAGGIRKMQQR
jgi:hypothetical protein